MFVLSELDRRVLGHLPAWAADEAAHVAMEGGPEVSIRSYGLSEFTVRLAEDPNAVGLAADGTVRHATESEVEQLLEGLVGRGFASRDDVDGVKRWRMTAAGFDAITGPQVLPDQIPGPVEIPLDPAHIESEALS